jgi:glycosyltransferase involved in cell wall biosynthesis
MSHLRISIVTPSFNQGSFIERTVRSVFGQNYPGLEYILMDGGSTDDTLALLKPYCDRFTHFRSGPDRGQADAVASGFEVSTGEIMSYLNSDDVLAPGALQFVNEFFQRHPRVDAIYSHRVAIDEADKVIWYWILPRHVTFLQSRWDFIPQETCFWRRSLFNKVGNIDRAFRFAMDYDLFVRFMNAGRFERVNRFLAAFRVHASSKTSTQLDTVGRQEIDSVRNKHGLYPGPRLRAIEEWFNNLPATFGRLHAEVGRSLPGAFPGTGYDYDELWGGWLKG